MNPGCQGKNPFPSFPEEILSGYRRQVVGKTQPLVYQSDRRAMIPIQDKSFAEFFAGIGLMRMGLERAGWKISFANDIDEDKWCMYRDHFGDTGEFVLGDVHELDLDSVPEVALATASFPRNDLSLAGARTGLAGAQSWAHL
ncbi:MAG: DNA cytosine methyltransferase [Terrimicrobiaceae bacterium]